MQMALIYSTVSTQRGFKLQSKHNGWTLAKWLRHNNRPCCSASQFSINQSIDKNTQAQLETFRKRLFIVTQHYTPLQWSLPLPSTFAHTHTHTYIICQIVLSGDFVSLLTATALCVSNTIDHSKRQLMKSDAQLWTPIQSFHYLSLQWVGAFVSSE